MTNVPVDEILKTSGLIRPEVHLIDKVALIAQGALARYILNEESKGGAIFDSDLVDSLEWSFEDFEYLHLAIKRGESDLEDVTHIFSSTLKLLRELNRKIVDPQEKSTLRDTLDIIKDLDPKKVFDNPKENKGDLRMIAWGLNTLHEYTKSKTQKKMVYDHNRDFVEDVRSKLSDNKERTTNNWRVDDKSLSVPILITVEFMASPPHPAHYSWGTYFHNIVFNFSTTKETWGVFEFNQVKDHARHELVHLMQKEFAIKKDLRNPRNFRELMDTGLPFSKYDPKYRQHMKEKGKELKMQYSREGLNMHDISIHALDDIEFYSRLLDEVVKFKRFNKNPTNKEIRKALNSQFFKSLKRYKKKSWNKAVGIFVSEVTPSIKKKAARPIRINKSEAKDLTEKAIEYIEEIAKKSKDATLSEAMKRRTMKGVIYLGTVMESETPISIKLMVKKTHEGGAYSYTPHRGLHEIEIYLEDQKIKDLNHPYLFKMVILPKMTKRIYSVLIHELTHAVERIRYLQHEDPDLMGFGGEGTRIDKSKIKTRKDKEKALKSYYNNKKEVKAYLQEIADEVEQYFIKKHGGVSKESLSKGFNDAFGYYGSTTWKKVVRYLTPKNQKYIKKAVLTYLMESINVD